MQRIWNRLRKRFRKPKRYYDIDGFVLDMGEHHLLSAYQEDCPMFSRFIPYLGELGQKVRPTGGVIIDLGANVGDTAAAMIKHTNAHILCIEPTNAYYALLKKNILLLEPQGARIKTLQAFISDKKQGYQADVSGGGTAVQKESLRPEAPTFFYRKRLSSVEYLWRMYVGSKLQRAATTRGRFFLWETPWTIWSRSFISKPI